MTPEIIERITQCIKEVVADGCQGRCALSILADHKEAPSIDSFPNLITVGESFGLTVTECHGVMDGWDVSASPDELASVGGCFYKASGIRTGYAEGFALGKALYEAFGVAR